VEWSLGCHDLVLFFYVQGLGFLVGLETRDVFFFPMAGKRTRLFNLKMDIDR